MKIRHITSFLLLGLSLVSCGKTKTYKVTLIGHEHLSWGKSEDKASNDKDYLISPTCDKGYCLYDSESGTQKLFVTIDGVPAELNSNYTFNDDTQQLKIFKDYIKGEIKIEGTSSLKVSNFILDVPNTGYTGIWSTSMSINIEHPTIKYENINVTSGIIPQTIEVEPSNLIYDYGKNTTNDNYHLIINQSELYQNIKIKFPTL